jgi:glycosyltransferase involved in cell wall biosynthesis
MVARACLPISGIHHSRICHGLLFWVALAATLPLASRLCWDLSVLDDASSDATAAIARQQGAQVVRVEHRQIAATRNSGAQQAHGDILFFVDADTLTNAPAIQSALRAIRAGAVGVVVCRDSRAGCPGGSG